MKKILFFYLLCCISIILLWLAIDDCDIESKDFKFGFNALFFYHMYILWSNIYNNSLYFILYKNQ